MDETELEAGEILEEEELEAGELETDPSEDGVAWLQVAW